jgi:hypothetical protein
MSISKKCVLGIAALIVLFSVVVLVRFADRGGEDEAPATQKILSSERPAANGSVTLSGSRSAVKRPEVDEQPSGASREKNSLLQTVLSSLDRGKKPSPDPEKSGEEPASSSDIVTALEEAETHEEMAEKAAKIAQSGVRSDILALLGAIEAADDDADRDTLARSLQALDAPEMGPDLVAFLLRNAEDPIIAEEARNALARIIAPDDIGQIVQVIPSDPEQELSRFYLLSALAQINNPASVDALTALCELTKDEDIQTAASIALGAIGTPDAVSSLITLIEDFGVEDLEDPLAQALMSSANKDSRELLTEESVASTNPVVQGATAAALASLNEQSREERGVVEGLPTESGDRN